MSLLTEICACKRKDVAERMSKTPFAALKKQAQPTTRSLLKALSQPGPRFILECKKASPSEGTLRPDFDAQKIAETYRGFADAVSVLTDATYFQGSFAHLQTIRATLTQPVLCKDFILEPYQVFEARIHGADAVLLMLSILDDEGYRRCAEASKKLEMEVLTEIHDEEELERALALNARLVGINNRNLKTMQVDLSTTRRLAPKIPRDKTLVCESGIKSRADVEALGEYVDAFLVGSCLMKEARLDLALRALLFGRVKICGLTTAEAARAAYEAGASWGGLIFAPTSPRCVSETKARDIANASPMPMVGVFVNDSAENILYLANALRLKAIQLHGEEPPAFLHALRQKLPGECEIWKALAIEENSSAKAVERAGEEALTAGAAHLLLDTPCPGTGKRLDGRLLGQLSKPLLSKAMLAGGIGLENITEAQRLGAYGLDVNSGVESAPGEKNLKAMAQLFSHLRECP